MSAPDYYAQLSGSPKLRPLGKRVLLRKIEASSRGGIVDPTRGEGDEGTQEYELVRMPFDIDYKPALRYTPLPVGARIYLARHKGWKIETRDGEELYVADVEDILAVEESA